MILQIIAWLIILIPVSFLIAGTAFSYYFRLHRRTIGIVLIVIGALGATIIFGNILMIVNREYFTIINEYIFLFGVEIATIFVGFASLIHRRPTVSS